MKKRELLSIVVLGCAAVLSLVSLAVAQYHHEPVRITNGPVIETLRDNEATVAWSTNVQGSTKVYYGTDPRNLSHLAEAPWGANGDTHRVRIYNLRPDTTYFFAIETGEARGTGTEVESRYAYSFRTLPPGAEPIKNQPVRQQY